MAGGAAVRMKRTTPSGPPKSLTNHLKIEDTRAVRPSGPAGGLVELHVEPVGRIGLPAEIRARQRCAHKGHVHARLVEAGAEDIVLDLVQRVFTSGHRPDLPLPDGPEQVAAVPDAAQGVVIDHGLDGQQVVGVHPEGDPRGVAREPLQVRAGEVCDGLCVARVGAEDGVVDGVQSDPQERALVVRSFLVILAQIPLRLV